MSYPDQLGKRLKELRLERGYTRKRLSVLSGVSNTSIEKLENGGGDVRTETFHKLMRAMCATPQDYWYVLENEKLSDKLTFAVAS